MARGPRHCSPNHGDSCEVLDPKEELRRPTRGGTGDFCEYLQGRLGNFDTCNKVDIIVSDLDVRDEITPSCRVSVVRKNFARK